eukprot:TRINITY_DN26872_c0_g2_i1.p1 TRINITY_DN26872_c0_g2~~TRINITY_DN26872_c0_g2_i1.p1  ORF type:complete len:161 (+),score=40.20 TRINITY_DN26872_c0_g2_i1:164-646(+)
MCIRDRSGGGLTGLTLQDGYIHQRTLAQVGTAEPSLEIVTNLGMLQQVVFSSFNHERPIRVKELAPTAVVGFLYSNPIPPDMVSVAKAGGADEVHLRYDTLSAELVQEVHEMGMEVMAWFRGPADMADVSELQLLRDVVQMKTDGICTNRPDGLYSILHS